MTATTRARVTWADLAWVSWRTHRAVIALTVGVAVLGALLMVWNGAISGPHAMREFRLQSVLEGFTGYFETAVGAFIAVFWGAPLVSREYEQRTNLVAWGQDAPPARWLFGQVTLLGSVASAIAVAVGSAASFMYLRLRDSWGSTVFGAFDEGVFGAGPQVQVGYALFGFALGVACGTLTRRTLPSMAITLVGFLGTREVLAPWGRQHYLPPAHTFDAWTGFDYSRPLPDGALQVDFSFCRKGVASPTCVKTDGVAGTYVEFQPVERAGLLQWIEAGILVVLAAGLLALAWYWLKRARRV